jgi:hypothetical protein
MIIQINTDKNISGNEKLEIYLKSTIDQGLSRISERISRVEVHLSDENAGKTGHNDQRCMLEARLENKQPIAVTSHGNTVEQAVGDALEKLKSLIERQVSSLSA